MQSIIETRLQLSAMTLAEEMNFTRAADRLNITQPALSKQIVDLENRLGFKVFERCNKSIELTDAGQVFLRGCKDAHAILERAIRQAKTTHDGIQPVVTIGHSPYADPELMAAFLTVHLPLYGNLRLRMESMFSIELSHAVLASELDIAIIAEPHPNQMLTQVHLATHPLCVLMPSDHPASEKATVELSDFSGVGWMVFARKAHPVIYDRLMEEARKSEVSPLELHHYMSPQEAVPLIAENFGVAFMAQGVAEQLLDNDLVVRPLSHSSLRVNSYLILRTDETSRLINQFGRALLRKVLPKARLEEAPSQLQLDL